MAERLKAIDCKSIEVPRRRFESYSLLQSRLLFRNMA